MSIELLKAATKRLPSILPSKKTEIENVQNTDKYRIMYTEYLYEI